MHTRTLQKIPTNWEKREQLRKKGQFFTPEWIAEAMIEYVVENAQLIFDPATGDGAFYSALKKLYREKQIQFYGLDIDEQVLNTPIYHDNGCTIEVRDFLLNPPPKTFPAIIANPPYIRHHRLSETTKIKLKETSRRILGFTLDGRIGLHIYFLIQALHLLQPQGKLAFILPADTCEGIFAKGLWEWITTHFRLECVVTFVPEAAPFPEIDTNAIIFFIKNAPPQDTIYWVKTQQSSPTALKEFMHSDFCLVDRSCLDVITRDVKEALKTGLSRPPGKQTSQYKLSDFAKVMRGIATGANDFFYLTRKQAQELGIPDEFLKPAIGRTRDVDGDCLTQEMLDNLDQKGRPTLLFSPDNRALHDFPNSVKTYLLYGEQLELPKRPLIKTRNPWYKMENRVIPPFLFAYLGRRNVRFIRNKAHVLPLSCFLCVFPLSDDEYFIQSLWDILNHPETINNLSLVGKSYGAGAIKVEPRALENLPIPEDLVKSKKLFALHIEQLSLL